MPVFHEKQEELEHYETMMGLPRGRLAVTMDVITDAMALVGQHGVYCQSQRWPGKPVLDIQIIMKNLSDAKELIQSVMEELKKAKEPPATCLLKPWERCLIVSGDPQAVLAREGILGVGHQGRQILLGRDRSALLFNESQVQRGHGIGLGQLIMLSHLQPGD